MFHSDRECDVYQFLADICDPEERARFRREFGLLDHDSRGHICFAPPGSSGPEGQLGRAIIGHDLVSYFGGLTGDENLAADLVRHEVVRPAERERTRVYISLEDVRTIYDAAAFMGQEYGLCFNAMITVAYKTLGIVEPAAMTKLLTDFLDEAGDQVTRWGYPWHTVYVHENSDERGLHTHILATIDPGVRGAFTTWARDGAASFFWRHCKCATAEAVDIVIKAPTTDLSKVGWQQDRLQYLTKGMDPTLMARDVTDGILRRIIDLVALKERYRNRPAG
jgi:hypothetical protein